MGTCPLNHIPDDLDSSAEGGLSKERQTSSIPRTSTHAWQYPSEAMFSAALHRKNHPAPSEAIPSMLAIHNSLNEQVWQEIMSQWESKYNETCKEERRLVRFRGRPTEWSPMAWWYYFRWGVRPFDRHDWVVERCGVEVRYVIDYYEAEGEFSCVIRPALDSIKACWDRLVGKSE